MKRKSIIMKIATLMCAMALMLSMTSVTAFAAKDDDSVTGTDSVTTDSVTKNTDNDKSSATKSPSPTESTDSRYNVGLTTSKPEDDSINATDDDDISASETAIDSTEKPTEGPDIINDSTNMNASTVDKDKETVKTGEFDMIPIIGALAVITIIAGAGYMIYTKKKK